MNRKWMCVCAIFLLLCLPIAGCGRENSQGEIETRETGAQSQIGADDKSAVQYAYSSIIVDFMEYGSDVVVHDIAGQGDQVYVLLEVREWGPEPEDYTQKQDYTSYYQVFSCLTDGSRKKVSEKIYLPESGGYVNTMQLSDDGSVAAVFYSDTDSSVSLLFWDGFQDVHWESEIVSGGYLFFQEEGFVILARNGDGRVANYYNAQGEQTGSVEVEGESFGNFQNCFLMPDSRFLVIATDNEGRAYAELYDPKTGQGERRMALPDLFRHQVFQGTMADILLCDSVGVYRLDIGQNTSVEILSYVDADLAVDRFEMVRQIDETHLAGIFNDGGVMKLGLFSRTQLPAGAQKQLVVLGTMGDLDGGLRRQIIAFNQENSRYRITVKQYAAYDGGADALTQLNLDILSGKMPDILLVDEKMPLQSYIAKGLLADVGRLLEEDGELDSGQFMENVLDAFRVNGTLYYVVPSFSVDTLVAKQSRVGNKTGWNQEEFSEVMAGLPQGAEMISETSRYGYLEDYMRACGREYVDTDQGKCNFQSETFVSALTFAATLPEYVEEFYYEENCYDSRYIEDRALLQPVTIRYIPDLADQIYGCMGEEIAYVGYPSESREGSCIRICGISFVLSGKSDKLEGAWEFARYFLTADFQRDKFHEIEGNGLPTRRDIFAEKAQRAAVQEGYCFINDEYTYVPPMTQEQIDRAVGFIEGLHNPAFEDGVIMNIIYEEADSFFQGQKTAGEVAALIQNRAQLYLSEGM